MPSRELPASSWYGTRPRRAAIGTHLRGRQYMIPRTRLERPRLVKSSYFKEINRCLLTLVTADWITQIEVGYVPQPRMIKKLMKILESCNFHRFKMWLDHINEIICFVLGLLSNNKSALRSMIPSRTHPRDPKRVPGGIV